MRSISARLWILAFCSALLQILPFPIAGPVPYWRRLFCWFCLTPLLYALLSRGKNGVLLRPGQTALISYFSGVFWYLGNCYWIYQTMHTYGDLPKPAAWGILLLFSLYVSLYHALFGWAIGWLHGRLSRQAVLSLVPFVWVAVELARARVTGFPWDLLGYTQVDHIILSRLAPWAGVLALSFLVATVNSVWLLTLQGKSIASAHFGPAVAILMVVMIAISAKGFRTSGVPASATAILIQENLKVGAEATDAPETKEQMLAAFSELSLTRPSTTETFGEAGPLSESLLSMKPKIIAWPEAPAEFFDRDPAFRNSMSALARRTRTPVIVNDIAQAGITPDNHRHLYNSAAFFATDGSYAGRYDKMRLVPFGEYTPFAPLFFFAGHLLGDLPFLPGLERKIFNSEGQRYGVFICYESIFGDDIRHFALDGAQVLVNISDDGWYGDSSAPWEHLDMVRMRAIENDRWILRATNTGVTASIDPFGRVTATIPRHVRGSMLAGFSYRDHKTFYTRYGDWFGWVCVLVSLGGLVFGFSQPAREVH